MSPHHDRLKELLQKRMNDQLTDSEQQELDDFLDDLSDEELTQAIEEVFDTVNEVDPSYYDHDWEAVRHRIIASSPAADQQDTSSGRSIIRPSFYRLTIFRYAAAALLLMTLAGSLWYFLRPTHAHPSATTMEGCGLRLPSKEEEGVIKITMVHDQVTLSVPRSWQYTFTLPDGSQVWLNAASSITYPRQFTGDTRDVVLEGEAFFQLDTTNKAPFYVTTRGQRLPVPRDHVNINAYEEQIVAEYTMDNIRMPNGWKEGYFAFRETPVQSMMSELARWYDWKVVYDHGVKPKAVTTSFCRTTTETDALQVLRSHGIQFQKKGNELIVL